VRLRHVGARLGPAARARAARTCYACSCRTARHTPKEVKSEAMIRRSLALLAAVPVAGALLALSPRPAEADTVTLTVGTLAPAESPWGKVFKVWRKAVGLRTNGAVDLQFFWNGQQGDEGAMVGKMRTGQLDGAAITANGLSMIYKDILVLQLPGLYRDWGKLDNARNGMRTRLDAEFDRQGFKVLGWGDVGMAHIMSKGFDVKTPDDLKHKNAFFIAGDPIEPMFYSAVGDVTPRQVSVPEILTGLTANTINVVNAPALAAEQLQWASRLDHLNTAVTGIGIGALLFTSSKINSLPADAQTALLESGKAAGEALTVSIRNEDNAAYQRLKARMVTFEPGPTEQAAWDAVFATTRSRLRGATFNAAIFDEAVRLAQ
jgi:TRAP-type C4-dicarboxylate transport system substrate-binding protein